MNTNITPSSDAEKEYVDDQLVNYNRQILNISAEDYFIPLSFNIKTKEGLVIAGINAFLHAKSTVFVSILWVNEKYRGKDYGTILLKHLEKEAKSRGAKLIYLDTYDFQAKDFYLKQGYEEFAVLKGDPIPGHTKFFMKKEL